MPGSQQNYGNSLGLDFEVLAPIDVLALGMYDGGNDSYPYIFNGVAGTDFTTLIPTVQQVVGVTVLIYNTPSRRARHHRSQRLFQPCKFQSQPPNNGEGQQINAENFLFLSSAVESVAGQLQRGDVERLGLERQPDWSNWWDEP